MRQNTNRPIIFFVWVIVLFENRASFGLPEKQLFSNDKFMVLPINGRSIATVDLLETAEMLGINGKYPAGHPNNKIRNYC